jgi:hypothetical protein
MSRNQRLKFELHKLKSCHSELDLNENNQIRWSLTFNSGSAASLPRSELMQVSAAASAAGAAETASKPTGGPPHAAVTAFLSFALANAFGSFFPTVLKKPLR